MHVDYITCKNPCDHDTFSVAVNTNAEHTVYVKYLKWQMNAQKEIQTAVQAV